MKLYFAPGACSIGIHYLLEEIAQPFERQRVDIRNGQHLEPWYVAINPKRKVPALQRADGSVLTEFPVIARYVAEQAPLAELMPKDPEAVLRASELTEFLVSTIHMQGFSRTFRPEKFAADESTFEATRAKGRDIIRDGLSAVEDRVKLETAPTFADAALFYILFWACERLKLDVPQVCSDRWRDLRSRPAARRAFEAEGIVV